MLGTFLDKLNVFFDRRFMIAYWSPIFIGLGFTVGLVGVLVGPLAALGWWTGRSGTEQVLLGVGVLLVITVLAYVLEALTIPIVRLYEGYWPKGLLTNWACTRQKARKAKSDDSACYHNYPLDSDLMKPTRLGNVLVASEDYPHQLYQLDAVLWWPRLAALLPETFRTQVDMALTPMLAMLNLSMMFTLLAFGGGIAVLLTNRLWWLLGVVFLGGLLLARVCYLVAVNQAVDYGESVRVAFDLYRYDIFKQMHIPLPENLFKERLLWDLLNKWLFSYARPWEIGAVTNVPQPNDPFYNDTHQAPAMSVQPQEMIITIKDVPVVTLKHE
jgi:hypothetical protein